MGIEQDCVSCDPKLFLGQLQSDVARDDLFPVFSAFGKVERVDILGNSSAMIWFARWTDAEKALEAAEAGKVDVGGKKKVVIRIADPPRRGTNLTGIKPKKLFIGQVPRNVVEGDLRALFQRFGNIVEFEMPQLRHASQGKGSGFSNTGCAFVRYEKWAEAEKAIQELHERHQFPESRRPLVVKFADAKPAEQKSRSLGSIGGKRPLSPDIGDKMCKRMGPIDPVTNNMSLNLVAMNSNTMGYGMGDPLSLGFLASQMGPPMGTGTMTGMGRMGMMDSGNGFMGKMMNGPSAMDLDNCPPNHGMAMHSMNLVKQDNPKFSMGSYNNNGNNRGGGGFIGNMNGMGGLGMGIGSGISDNGARVMNEMAMNSMEGGMPLYSTRKMSLGNGPNRCYPDAPPLAGPSSRLGKGCTDPRAKEHTLFIGQIPHEADEYDLWAVFSQIGEILELNILRRDGRSRGAAFVTYASRDLARMAIEKLDGTCIPWDPTARKLAVRFKEKHSSHRVKPEDV
ncbi:hypothetical protein BSKO_01359 [Bryopsis sp. KO-2023]|nr:hypothetical protein BSKO_01359 [Bryopsis sp. KO-2023]